MKVTRRTSFVFGIFFLFLGVFPLEAAPQVLFDGQDLTGWVNSKSGEAAQWKVENGYLEGVPGLGDIETLAVFEDFDLHAEFWIPYLPHKTGQDRGNSGIFLQGRYEIQILDTWNNETYLEGICGALYKLIAPKINMSLPPEQWQTYDIQFKSPRLDSDGQVVEKGEVTVVHNGQIVIERGLFERGTGSAAKKQQGVPGPIRLQDHGSAVRFRNLILSPR
ncbi:MAG: DUF1080 domain-containing protein [Proteobacteria bacterium]|nr:DUF1080 domain-containing protein [Pseudomonadota bacterium]NDD05942.1 DUF1080 domain-containing protein [Pseudomonadota bacterium]NDG25796.1 DUF1080 domain-containing protein [Pseudomonadota bacterium]